MNSIILVLGAPNDKYGNLSKMAIDRVECAFSLYANNDHARFLCTGGFGQQFNTTSQPHAYYSKQYLLRKGAKEMDFLEFVPTTNTVEDFRMSKPIIEREKPDMLLVVTSDYHIKRAKILHDIILKYSHTVFIPAKSSLTGKELTPLLLHEELAIWKLQENNYILY